MFYPSLVTLSAIDRHLWGAFSTLDWANEKVGGLMRARFTEAHDSAR